MAYAHPEQLVDTDVGRGARRRRRTSASSTCGRAGYADGHVPGAVYLSPVAIRDAKSAADVSADARRRSRR